MPRIINVIPKNWLFSIVSLNKVNPQTKVNSIAPDWIKGYTTPILTWDTMLSHHKIEAIVANAPAAIYGSSKNFKNWLLKIYIPFWLRYSILNFNIALADPIRIILGKANKISLILWFFILYDETLLLYCQSKLFYKNNYS